MLDKVIVSLSFDDGREDTYRVAYGIMRKYGLTGTIHVATGYVDKTFDYNPEVFLSSKGPISIEQLKEMKQQGFEISSHGDKHITERLDILKSLQKLREWGLVGEKAGFSIPYSKLEQAEKIQFSNYIKTLGVSYMRGGRNPSCYTFKSKMHYLIYNFTSLQWFYDSFNRYNCINLKGNPNPYDLCSVVIKSNDKPFLPLNFIKKAAGGNWIILMLHSIQHTQEATYVRDKWCWSADRFEYLCSCLKKMSDAGELLVKPIMDVVDEMGLYNEN